MLLGALAEDLLHLAVEPAERPEPDDHLDGRDLGRVLAVEPDAALPHPRPEPAAHEPRDGPPEGEAAEHQREQQQEDGVEDRVEDGLDARHLEGKSSV